MSCNMCGGNLNVGSYKLNLSQTCLAVSNLETMEWAGNGKITVYEQPC